jgi:hypothetical protein
MKRLNRYLEIRKEKHAKDNDTIGVIYGLQGISKSNLAMWILENWEKLNFGEVRPDTIKKMGLTKEMFATALSEATPNSCVIFDEAGELSNRRALSNFNVAMIQAYQVIRADKMFTVLVLPDFWDLESHFRNKTIKFLIHVYERGRFAFWLREDILKINEINRYRMIKNPYVVRPRFFDTFPIYNGEMAEEYQQEKLKKTAEARAKLKDMFSPQGEKVLTKKDLENAQIEILEKIGYDVKETAELLGLSSRTVYRRKKSTK